MRRRTMKMAALLALSVVGAVETRAIACGFDGALGANFSALHPKSLVVAFAVRDAVTKGRVDRAAIAPLAPGPNGYWRAASRIRAFQRRMSASAADRGKAAGVSVLFVESQLWSRLTPQADGYRADLHMQGPMSGDVVIVTNETVLAAMLDGTLKARDALDLGVVVVDGEQVAVEAVKKAMAAELDRTPTAAAMSNAPATSAPLAGRKP
jgi:hypothetical protein